MRESTKTIGDVTRLIDEITHPVLMSIEEAKEFLETLQVEIEGRIDGLNDDLKNRDRE